MRNSPVRGGFGRARWLPVLAGLGLIAAGWLWSSSSAAGQQPAESGSFSDLDGSPYLESILALERRRVLAGTGCSPDQFCPGAPADRRTAAIWLVRLLDEDNLPTTPSRFSDVDPDSPGAEAIERLAELGITTGCGHQPPRFCPDRQLSRAHLAVFLVRAYGLQPADPVPEFADVDSDSWLSGPIGTLASHNLDLGCNQSGPRYCPGQILARGELADLIYRISRRVPWLKPDPARHVHVARDDAGRLLIRWRPSRRGIGPDPVAYRVRWWSDDAGFGSGRQAIVNDPNQLWHLVDDVSSRMVYSVRVRAVNQIALSSPSTVVSELGFSPSLLDRVNQPTTEAEVSAAKKLVTDRLWLHIEQQFLPVYEADNPWLRVAWNHVKNKTDEFVICLNQSDCNGTSFWASVDIDCRSLSRSGDLPHCWADRLTFRHQHIDKNWLIAHELGHVLTLANGVVDQPEPLALAFLYFVDLTRDDQDCAASELYADSLEYLVVGPGWAHYWEKCRLTGDNPSDQALVVVRQALAGETSDWFVDHYRRPGGGLDYESIWTDVNRLAGEHRLATIYNLGQSFGGYCDEQALAEIVDQDQEAPDQPWVDGGCRSWAEPD